jgi:hypothetical protein
MPCAADRRIRINADATFPTSVFVTTASIGRAASADHTWVGERFYTVATVMRVNPPR